jgi:hygromycin-B 7''-O-kinase
MQQFQAALDRFQLGQFLHAEPVRIGNIGQNVFRTSSQGALVLRGAPFDAPQVPGERWFMQQLHEHTQAPVPWPYLLDRGSDIFGWSYIIMPRLPGRPLAEHQVKQRLSSQERKSIARALGATRAELHSLTWPCVGNYDLPTQTIQPLERSYADQLLAQLHRMLAACGRAC